MIKLNKDALNAVTENIKQPLDHLYSKLEAEGVFTKVGAGEVYQSIYKFITDLGEFATDDFGHSTKATNVMIDGDEYRKVGK
tara:strand:+ start:189 stop:434 length:246 start_codon:yes stop_codon:yes gene_type:complete